MKIFMTFEAPSEARFDKVLAAFQVAKFDSAFERKKYGESLNEVAFVLVCYTPIEELKQRIRMDRKERVLYIDLMFDLQDVLQVAIEIRHQLVAKKILAEVPFILAKYKFPNFDLIDFIKDLETFFRKKGWIG